MMRSNNNTLTSQQTPSGAQTAVQLWRRRLVIASAAGMILIGILGVGEAQVRQQDAPFVQQVSREQADQIMGMNYKVFAELRKSPNRPTGYRWDTDGCTPDWALKYFTRACYVHDFGYRNYGSAGRTRRT